MIPKGMVEPGETPVEAALREFEEETGTRLTTVPFPLATVRQAGGKLVEAFALEGDLDPAAIRSNEFEVEWPPRSGRLQPFPEVAEARWMTLDEARHDASKPAAVLDALEAKLEDETLMRRIARIAALQAAAPPSRLGAAAPASAKSWPTHEGDVVLRNFRFRSGESLPELRIHYTTLGPAAPQSQRARSIMR